jgi:hypothetical protein
MIAIERFNKYIVAIQDISQHDKLSGLMLTDGFKLQTRMSISILESPYLYEDDDAVLINDKRTILLDKILHMPDDVIKLFNKKYPNLLTNITAYIGSNRTVPTDVNIEIIDRYWWDIFEDDTF